MRYALLCVLVALIIREESQAVANDDFRPTPIPLKIWHEKRGGQPGTLQEVVKTDAPPSVAAIPAHYWEDALRHSVYLTLVRDKIDQLIAKEAVTSANSKAVYPASKEVDDLDMWEKIKSAPFDRLTNEEPASFGDVTIMAKGRLLNDKGAFRFAEDETSREKCSQEKCMEGVKAFWSVKRVRHRDVETSPGRYHYELTFSVTSQTPKKQRKLYENPVRTFTVQENGPVEQQRIYEPINYNKRPQRAVWFHKNIEPTQYYHGHNLNQGLDRTFLSLFSDEDVYEEPRYKPNPYIPQVFRPSHPKAGYVGAQNEQHQYRKPMQYSYKPQSIQYSRPPLPAPPLSHIQPYVDFDGFVNSPYPSPHGDHRYMSSNVIKTTRPAVLPTPVMPAVPASFTNVKNLTIYTTSTNFNVTENTTKDPEDVTSYKMYSKPKHTPMKHNYFTEHVRPPVFSAPPGVFVTMDKKPFKPMPPLKLMHNSRPMKSKPIDFRPSPQVLDKQFSDPDPLSDFAFRPITVNYVDSNTTEKSDTTESDKKRKLNPNDKKPAKKNENMKSQRVTTTTPDIITASSESFEQTDSMEWANLLGAFTKTTPMASPREKTNVTESIESVLPTTVSTTTATEAEEKISTTTTAKPKKRTRPPHKFTKQEKPKKYKRITTTSTTKAPEKPTAIVPQEDLTPQASSAATTSKPGWKPKNKTHYTTPMSTSTSTVSTTSKPSTTTTQSTTTSQSTTSTTTKEIENSSITPLKNNNRYRQTTLMIKGTSVKHDRWSTPSVEKNKTIVSSKYPPRRKGSNFQGYASSTPGTLETELKKQDHQDHVTSSYVNMSSTIEPAIGTVENASMIIQTARDESVNEYDTISDITSSDDTHQVEEDGDPDQVTEDQSEESEEQESIDHNEYIFDLTTIPDEINNQIIEHEKPIISDETTITSPHSSIKNKTKCQKKKHHNLTTTEENYLLSDLENEETTTLSTSTTTTESMITPDFFDELLGGFTLDETPQETKVSQSTTKPELDAGDSDNKEHYVQIDDDFEEFLDSLERKHSHNDEKSEEEYGEEDDKDFSQEDSPFNNEEENREARNTDVEYNDYQDRPYSLLELIAME